MNGISIYSGIKTGCNKAFIINSETKDRLVKKDPLSEEILYPIIEGRDIDIYRANWKGLWLIATYPAANVDILRYPAIKQHLESFEAIRLRKYLMEENLDQNTYKWYELQATSAYYQKFSFSKLFWMQMTSYGRFAIAEPGLICNNAVFAIFGDDIEYLCAVLNSRLITWLVHHTAATTGKGLPKWEKFTVNQIPIVEAKLEYRNILLRLIYSILTAIDNLQFEEADKIQDKIDDYIFHIYGLNESERKIVPKYFRFSPLK